MDYKGIKAYIGDLMDVDITTNPPVNNDLLKYNSTTSTWIPTKVNLSDEKNYGVSYRIELDRWNIKNDGTNPLDTTSGINNAINWATDNRYDHVILPEGYYKLRMNSSSLSCIVVPSNIHFEMSDNTHIELETNSSPYYRVIELTGVRNVKISGGKITGDKKNHIYELGIKFNRGGVNSDGSLNNDTNFIRSEVIDRYNAPGLLRAYRLWRIPGITATSYSFYQYQDTVSSNSLKGVRYNGGFAPANPSGRGWFGQIEEVNKLIFVIDISSSTLTDAEIFLIRGKVDSQSYTHEFGHGIEIKGSTNIEVTNIEISDCTGDAIYTGWLEYKLDPGEYTQEQIGSRIYINNSNLHHCRRQGVSLGASNDVYIYNNKIHHIGYADDGITVDGTSPMFGIDVESQWSESNIPTWRPELNQEGFEINTRIYIFNNYIFNNARGHFVNADGINIVVESNTFEGYNVGGISSYQSNWYIKYINNTFIRCELTVKGDNFVNGVFCYKGNVKLQDIRGAHISNCTIKEGLFYGSSNYGYFGTPISVDIETGTYRYNSPHGMGNGAKICFEEWEDSKVPSGINKNKLYYTINVTSTNFQVSETKGGSSVSITDSGVGLYNISRFDYGRCFISNIVVERDWRNDTSLTPNFALILTGGVIENITVINYECNVLAPKNYAGRPSSVNSLVVLEGGVNLEACNISNSKFIRTKTGIIGGDININSYNNSRRVNANNMLFSNVGIIIGNAVLMNSKLIDSYVQKNLFAENLFSKIINSYFEYSRFNLQNLTLKKGMVIANCVFENTTFNVNNNTVLFDNIDVG